MNVLVFVHRSMFIVIFPNIILAKNVSSNMPFIGRSMNKWMTRRHEKYLDQ